MSGTNRKFLDLPAEKREKIVNAGFEVFGQSDYRHASTEEIAAKAGISKGLLFYYFQNKQTFYAYLLKQAVEMVKKNVMDEEILKITDFFDYCECAARRKYDLMRRSPYVMDYLMRAFYSKNEVVSEDANRRMTQETAQIAANYFKNIDLTKFRDDVDFRVVYHMLVWMVDGYMHERQRSGKAVSLDEMMDQYLLIASYIRKMAYKEECLK